MPRPFAPFLAFLHARDANHLRTPFATGWMVVGTNGGGSADWIVGTLGSVFDEQFPGKHARLARERRRYQERRQYDAYQRLCHGYLTLSRTTKCQACALRAVSPFISTQTLAFGESDIALLDDFAFLHAPCAVRRHSRCVRV